MKISSILGLVVKTFESQHDLKYSEDSDLINFFKGVLLSVDERNAQQLRMNKNYFELGRTAGFAIRTRGHFRSIDRLGALRKSNFFFGNNPGETIDNRHVVYFFREIVESYISSPYVRQINGILTSLLEEVGFRTLNDDEISKAVEKSSMTFDMAIELFARVQRGSKQTNKEPIYRLPGKPNSSPLMLKEEMKLLDSVISPIYDSLDNLKRNWSERLMTTPWNELLREISGIMDQRWKLLEKFASVTTKRLQEIRQLDPAYANLRKAQTTLKQVSQLLKSRKKSVTTRFSSEILSLIPESMKNLIVLTAFEKDYPKLDLTDWKSVLNFEIHQLYMKVPDLGYAEVVAPPKETKTPLEALAKHANMFVEAFKNFQTQLNALYRKTPHDSSMIANIEQCIKNLDAVYKQLRIIKDEPNLYQVLIIRDKSDINPKSVDDIVTYVYSFFESLRTRFNIWVLQCLKKDAIEPMKGLFASLEKAVIQPLKADDGF